MLPRLSYIDTLCVITGLAFSTHMVFKHFEPYLIPVHFCLLFIPPAFATVLAAQHVDVLQAVASTFALFYAVLLSSIILYRISPIHPLSRYPGPLHLRTSKLWLAWVAYNGKQHIYVAKLHGRYGDAVRIGPNEVSYRDPAAINPLMGTNGLPRGPHLEAAVPEGSSPSLASLTDLQEHARRRKFWNRGFSPAALKEYEEFISKRATELVGWLSSEQDVVDLSDWFGRFSYDLMSDMTFGGGSEKMRDGDTDHAVQLIEHGMMVSWALGHVPWLGKYIFKIPRIAGTARLLYHSAELRASDRLKSGSIQRDLFYYMNDEDGIGSSRPTHQELVSDGIAAIVAGSDTVSDALTAIFYSLLRQPKIYKRLQEEVDKYHPPESNALDPKYHSEMSYLNAVINETLRLYPPAPSGSQRKIWENTGRVIGPFYLPPGTAAGMNYWALHHDERNFSPASNTFWPDRWLIASGEAEYQGSDKERFIHNTNAFIPFSFGPANCVGQKLAMQEMRMVVCLIMQKLELEFAEGWNPDECEPGSTAHLTAVREKLPVTTRLRENA